jgi:hypothetical protein
MRVAPLFAVASFAASLLAGCTTAPAAATAPESIVWRLDNLSEIGGVAAHPEGAPQLITTNAGRAVAFDGVKDALFIDKHPLAGATTFTAEAIFRPDGGKFEQRWMHLAEVDPKTGQETGTRFLFEIRVVGDQWYLDSFAHGPAYHLPIMVTDKLHPLGHWYRVAMTYDGTTLRSYVNGELQGEAPLAFTVQGGGHSSFGTRINRVDYFHGAVYEARFTPRALQPQEFLPLPAGLN